VLFVHTIDVEMLVTSFCSFPLGSMVMGRNKPGLRYIFVRVFVLADKKRSGPST
jgi:hypothetical protein